MLVASLQGKVTAFRVMPFFIPMQSPFSGGGGYIHPTEAAINGSLEKFQTPSLLSFPPRAIISGTSDSITGGHYD
jgi:hypothetical protein